MATTLAWERAGSQFFRNVDGPPLRWQVNLTQSHVRAALCSGVIAVWERDDIVIHRGAAGDNKSWLELFDAEGVSLGRIALDFGPVLDVLITLDETVVVATRSGLVRHYTEFGRNFVQVGLPFELTCCMLTRTGYIAQAARGSPGGLELAVVTLKPEEGVSGSKLATGSSSAEPRYHVVSLDVVSESVPNGASGSSNIGGSRTGGHRAGAEITRGIEACTYIPGDPAAGRVNRILVVDTNYDAYVYDMELSELSRRKIGHDVATKLVEVSPTGSFVVFSDGRSLKVYETDFRSSPFSVSGLDEHRELKWIGDEALALIADEGEADILSLADAGIGANNRVGDDNAGPKTTKVFFEEEQTALVSEIDGIRVLGQTQHSLYMPVYEPTLEIFKLGSLAPSAILYSSTEQTDSGLVRPNQAAKLLEPQALVNAVETCISAALLELEPKAQKKLMTAAAFGKSIADAYDSSRYIDTLPMLRVGNALRNLPRHPLFVTQRQLKALGSGYTLIRLINRRQWAEAVSVAEIYGIPKETVYIEWACDLIMNSDAARDEELSTSINTKMKPLGAYSHAKMALRAIEQGRQELATELVEHEPVVAERIKLFLEMGLTQVALEQSIRSGDPYLVDYVLLILVDELSLPQLMRVIGPSKFAIQRQQLLVQLKENASQRLHELLYQMDLRIASLQIEYNDVAQGDLPVDRKIDSLRALDKKFLSLGRRLRPEAQAASDWADLLSLQKRLETEFGTDFVGLSAAETISALLKIPQVSQAQKLRTKLSIGEQQFWWLRLRALADRREFDLIWELGQSKKSPIGYRPFYDVTFEAGSLDTAAKFVDLINDASLEEKVKLLVKAKHIDAARSLAAKAKDEQLVAMLNAM